VFLGVVALAAALQIGASPSTSAVSLAGTAALLAFVAAWRAGSRGSAASSPQQSVAEPAVNPRSEIARLAADGLPDALLLYSDAGVIRYCNPVARNLFFEGTAPEGKNFIRLVGAAPAALREALLGENDRLFAVQVDGWHQSYHLSRRQVQFEAEAHTLLLVKHLTRELGRREVEVLKRVVRLISHEANNSLAPITSLVNSARLIGKRPEHADKLERALSTIEERARHLASFLEGYARLARLPAPALRETNWAPLLAQLGSLYPALQLPPAPGANAWFDAVQVEQVLVNLIKNALEAGSAEAGVALELEVTPEGASVLQVLDRGSGFTEEARQQALLPLYTTKEHGSGMGLALAVEIVEAHGGSLALGNREGGGASVRVHLPGKTHEHGTDLMRSRLTLTRA
jgi:nitrogen fixation/metabolism regulation signal transduction histidine kinase